MPRAGWLAVGAICAALAGGGLVDAGVCLALALAAAVLGLGFRRSRGRAAQISLVALGAAIVLFRATAGIALTPPPATDDLAPRGDTHAAHVVSVGSPQAGQQRAVLELEAPETADRIYARLPRYPPLAAYDRVRFDGALEPAPADGPFGEYLARSGIGYTAELRSFEVVGAQDTPLAELEHLRRTAAELLARALPQPQSGLAAGLLIGLRDPMARDVAADFRTAGLSHIVAISGSHLALIAALAIALLGRLGRRPRSIIVIGLIWAYSFVAGAGPSVLRAAVMTSVVVGARESGRASQAHGALALTAVLMLVVDPSVVADVGFQLSLAATAGLLVWSTAIGERLRRRLPARTPQVLIDGLGMTLAAQLATQPLVLLHFGQLSVVAPLANVMAAPLVAPAMLSAAVGLAAGAGQSIGLPDLLVAPVGLLCALTLGALIAVAHFCASLPLASLSLPPPLDICAAILAALALAPLLRRRPASGPDVAAAILDARRQANGAAGPLRRAGRLKWAAAAAVGAVLVSAMVVSARPDGRLRMTVLDVGQGDSILLEGPAGGRILIDTGPDPDRLISLLDSRLPSWDRRLDVVVVTHPHEDHVAGLALLLDRYRVGRIAEPGMIGLGPGDAAFRRRLAELGRETHVLAAGDRLVLDGIGLEVLWPPRGRVPLHPTDGGSDVNNVSIVLAMQFGQRRFLLGGDIEQQIDAQLFALATSPEDDRYFDVLKVAHHGSATATTEAFLERVRPAVAVISTGWGNPYGHPSAKTIDRLEANGADVFRTDLAGSVAISTDGHDLQAVATGGRPTPTRPAALAPPGPGWCPIPQTAYAVRAP